MRDSRGHYLETISEVDFSAFARNLERIKKWVGDRDLILAVKANAYGHGVVPICKEAEKLGINKFGVANLTEAIELRDCGIKSSIILLTPPTLEQIPSIVYHNLTPNVVSLEFAQILSNQSLKAGRTTKCHIEIDTGMGRTGFFWDDCLGDIYSINSLKGVKIEGIFSHFPVADGLEENDSEYTLRQLARFSSVVEKINHFGLTIPMIHISNSAGILLHPVYGNTVRPGIMIYGLKPAPAIEAPVKLEPIFTLKSQVVQLRDFPEGHNIGYGRTFVTPRPMRIAVIRMGYGDGLKRSLSNKGEVLIRGRRHPIVGTVCMDTTMIAVNGDDIALDDEVVILGRQGDDIITANDHARWSDTINYEILTGISERVRRLYIRDGLIVGES